MAIVKKDASTSHGHRAGRVSVRSADDDTEHLDGLLAALHHAGPDPRSPRHQGQPRRGRSRSDDLPSLGSSDCRRWATFTASPPRCVQTAAAAHGAGDRPIGVHADPRPSVSTSSAPAHARSAPSDAACMPSAQRARARHDHRPGRVRRRSPSRRRLELVDRAAVRKHHLGHGLEVATGRSSRRRGPTGARRAWRTHGCR